MSSDAQLAGPNARPLARWPGVCSACEQPIRRGDVLARFDGAWLHESCAARRAAHELHRPLEVSR